MVEPAHPASAPTRETTASMSTARIVISLETFALGPLFERVPETRVYCEPTVPNPADHALLIVRADEYHRKAVEDTLRNDPAIATIEELGTHEDGWRYRVTWDGHTRQIVRQLVAASVTLLAVRGKAGSWKLRLLAPDRQAIAETQEILEDFGCEPDCQSVTSPDSERSGYVAMTDERHEALITAFEMDYHDIPRSITIEELAEEIGISHRTLSERFRRMHKQLIENELVIESTTHE